MNSHFSNEQDNDETFEQILYAPTNNPALPISHALEKLREEIVLKGIPATSQEEEYLLRVESKSTTRGKTWKILLGAHEITFQEYMDLVALGQSSSHSKIEDDAFRTFASDSEFCARVQQCKLVRVLNAVIHQAERKRSRDQVVVYVQGMNAICGIVLLELNEIDATALLLALLEKHCPLYLNSTLDSVYIGCMLVDQVLHIVDVDLFKFLSKFKLSGQIYCFPWLLSLGSCWSPHSEAVKLFDFLFAKVFQLIELRGSTVGKLQLTACQGVHWIVMCSVARVVSLRADLFASDR